MGLNRNIKGYLKTTLKRWKRNKKYLLFFPSLLASPNSGGGWSWGFYAPPRLHPLTGEFIFAGLRGQVRSWPLCIFWFLNKTIVSPVTQILAVVRILRKPVGPLGLRTKMLAKLPQRSAKIDIFSVLCWKISWNRIHFFFSFFLMDEVLIFVSRRPSNRVAALTGRLSASTGRSPDAGIVAGPAHRKSSIRIPIKGVGRGWWPIKSNGWVRWLFRRSVWWK